MIKDNEETKQRLEEAKMFYESFQERNKNATMITVSTKYEKGDLKKPISFKTINRIIRYILLCLILSTALLLVDNLVNILCNEVVVSIVLTVAAGFCLVAALVFAVVLIVLFSTRKMY